MKENKRKIKKRKEANPRRKPIGHANRGKQIRDPSGTQIEEKTGNPPGIQSKGKIGPGPIEHVNREEIGLYRDLTGIFGDSTGTSRN